MDKDNKSNLTNCFNISATDALMHNHRPEIIHSDQGSEYNSKDFVNFCSKYENYSIHESSWLSLGEWLSGILLQRI